MKKIALFLSIVVAAIACDKIDPVTPPEVDFANPDVVIPFQGSEEDPVVLSFTANVDWTAELDQAYDWISIAPTSGTAGEAAIEIYAAENEAEEVRAAVIKVKIGVSVLTFDVIQNGIPYLAIEPTEVSLPATGGSATVTVEANVEYVLTATEGDWLSYDYNAETGVYTFTATANEAYAARTATVTLSNNVSGVTASFVVSQEGKAKVLWEKSLADYSAVTYAYPIRLAYKDGVLVLAAAGSVHALNAEDGSYLQAVALPEGFVATSVTNDDAGNIVVAADAPAYGSSEIYAVSSLETLTPTKVATLSNADLYRPGGNLRAGGDVTENGVVTMYVDYEHYWIGCDIVNGEAQASRFQAIDRLEEAGSTWDPNAGCATPLGSKLDDGIIATFYTQPALVSNAAGEWAAVGTSMYTGNDNNCSVAEAVYGDVHFAAVAVGSHFNYSATGAYLYNLASGEVLYSYRVDGDLTSNGVNADVVLVPTTDALYMYYADLNKGRIACIEIK